MAASQWLSRCGAVPGCCPRCHRSTCRHVMRLRFLLGKRSCPCSKPAGLATPGKKKTWALLLWPQVVPLSGSMRPGSSAGGSAGTSPAAFLHEARMLHGLRHRCIVQLAGVALTKAQDKGLLIMELLPGGDLFKALNLRDRSSNRVFGWACKGKRVALDVASALAFLHNRRVMHYDLKVRHCGLDA